MAQFVIPTYFTAVNQLTPTLTQLTKQMFAFASAGAIVAGVIGGITFSGKSVMDYERELANLKALTGATGKEFLKFKAIIEATANKTRVSAVEVAKSFTTIANAMPELLNDADGLNLVTNATITLSRAARMELEPAAQSLTTILNQFGKSALESAATVDMMAAASKYGSAELNDLAESMREVGGAAQVAGVSLKESIAMAELVSKFKKGSEAGIQLRNVLIEMSKGWAQDPKAIADMQRLGVNIGLVGDKTIPIKDRLMEMSKVMNDSNALFHIFGKENQGMAFALLHNAKNMDEFLGKLDEVGNAQRMANENTNTLYEALKQLRDQWINSVLTNQTVARSLEIVTSFVRMLTDNLDTIIGVVVPFLGLMLAWKMLNIAVEIGIWGVNAAVAAYNFILGIAAVRSGTYNFVLAQSTAYSYGLTIATWAMNASFLQLAIASGGVLLAIGLVAGLIYKMTGNTQKLDNNVNGLKNTFTEIAKPIDTATLALNNYNAAVEKYNQGVAAEQRLNYNRQLDKKLGKEDNSIFSLFDFNSWRIFFRDFADIQEAEGKVLPKKEDYFLNKEDILKAEERAAKEKENPYMSAQTNEYYNYNKTEETKTVNIEVSAAPGTNASIKNNNGIPVNVTPTGGF